MCAAPGSKTAQLIEMVSTPLEDADDMKGTANDNAENKADSGGAQGDTQGESADLSHELSKLERDHLCEVGI